jgi:hypothetical protein
VWLLRNKALHGDDSTTLLLSYKHTQLLLDIQDIYDQPSNYWLDKPTTELKTFFETDAAYRQSERGTGCGHGNALPVD